MFHVAVSHKKIQIMELIYSNTFTKIGIYFVICVVVYFVAIIGIIDWKTEDKHKDTPLTLAVKKFHNPSGQLYDSNETVQWLLDHGKLNM